MRSYIDQFYNEGLATTFYLKPVRFFEMKIKNEILLKFMTMLVKIVYTVLALGFAWYMFWEKYPL